MVVYCKSPKCLIGKTAIITGANTGIGYETALDFAKRGARIILACRNKKRATEARRKIVEASENKNIVVKLLDLASLDSVRDFSHEINTNEDRLDILVNNAGSAYLPEMITKDGLQLNLQVNYFSHFLLTNLLLDLLKKSAPSRVINVSSLAAMFACPLNINELNSFPGEMQLYAKTKLCNILFTIELAKRIEGTGVTTYSLHPGTIHSDFLRFSSFWDTIAKYCFKTPEEGAQTTIYLSVQGGIEKYNGRHFDDSKPVTTYHNARDPELAKKLWKVSEKMVGLKAT